MNRDEIRLVIATELNVPLESVTDDATWESLDADSLDKVHVVMQLEAECFLGMTPDSEMERLARQPVGETIKYVEVQLENRRVG